jgi:phage tail-like protein
MPIGHLLPLKSNFTFAIDGHLQNGVIRISAVEQRCHVIENRHGAAPYVHKQPGPVETIDIEIEKVAGGTDELAQWRSLVKDKGSPQRSSISIGVLDRNGNPVAEFVFHDAMPVAWKLKQLDSTTDGNAVEVLRIRSERMEFGK